LSNQGNPFVKETEYNNNSELYNTYNRLESNNNIIFSNQKEMIMSQIREIKLANQQLQKV
jgi:hypothetical protein